MSEDADMPGPDGWPGVFNSPCLSWSFSTDKRVELGWRVSHRKPPSGRRAIEDTLVPLQSSTNGPRTLCLRVLTGASGSGSDVFVALMAGERLSKLWKVHGTGR